TSGRMPYAVVQLRQEDLMQSSYNMVGFQNHLKFLEQKRIFRMIPGLANAEFLRLGQIHRNTYINAPQTLRPSLAARRNSRIFFAGQLAGTEGYIENMASGFVAGINAVRTTRGEDPLVLPAETAIGALCRYVSSPQKQFAPMNINFGLLPEIDIPRRLPKTEKQRLLCERAPDLWRKTLSVLASLRSAGAFRGRDPSETSVDEIQDLRRSPPHLPAGGMPDPFADHARSRRSLSRHRDLG